MTDYEDLSTLLRRIQIWLLSSIEPLTFAYYGSKKIYKYRPFFQVSWNGEAKLKVLVKQGCSARVLYVLIRNHFRSKNG
jgi:hypothetical protein